MISVMLTGDKELIEEREKQLSARYLETRTVYVYSYVIYYVYLLYSIRI